MTPTRPEPSIHARAAGATANRFRRRRLVAWATAAAIAVQLEAPLARAGDANAAQASAQTAEQLGNQAYELHQQGKYAESIATYLRAYELSKASVILFNVATIYDRKLHERALASDYYRRYLAATDAEPGLVQKANERLETLKREKEAEEKPPAATPVVVPSAPQTVGPAQGAAAPPAAPTPASPPPAPAAAEPPGPRSPGWRTAGIIVGATGVAGIAASMALGYAAKTKNDDANAVCNGAACTSASGVAWAHDAGTLATASTITFAAGAGLVGVGAVMFFFAPRVARADRSPVAVDPQIGPGHAGLLLHGSF